MSRIRRTDYAFFHLQNQLDLRALFGGAAAGSAMPQILAISLLTGQRHALSRRELGVLLSIPSDRWLPAHGVEPPELVRDLVEMGLVLSDEADARLSTLRERDAALSGNEWNLYAALYHFMTKWSGFDIRAAGEAELAFGPASRAVAEAFVAEHGPPPAPFHPRSFGPAQPLPRVERDGDLFRALADRRTTRAFDPATPMSAEDLSTVLHYVFGCHGYARTLADVLCIKRTSPSGGGLHPIEAYPVVSNVGGVRSGIYHYDVRGHALELIGELDPNEARRTASSFMCGQSYLGEAHVSFVLTARFYRNHWKYRRHGKAYAGILMDAAHLSQTLYLVSASLGLGAFVTLAINSWDIEERLGLDGYAEGVIAVTGCGPRAPGESPRELHFAPAAAQPPAPRIIPPRGSA